MERAVAYRSDGNRSEENKEEISMERKNAWSQYSAEELSRLEAVNEDYKACLDAGKTERECVRLTIERIEKEGYKNLKEVIRNGEKVQAGDKVYAVCMDKTIAMFHMGTKPLEEGMNLLGAHIDSPRIDVKQNPLYESEGFVLADTHYYGGIKKYQWVTLPLALHGVIAKKDGTVVNVSIGEKEDDPVFVITDLLIHLAAKQMEKKASTVVEGEKLDLLIGSRPIEQDESLEEKEKEAVKANVRKIFFLQNWRLFRQEKHVIVVWIAAWCLHTDRMTVCVLSHLFLQCWM